MLAIRLQRTGRSGHSQFRVIVQDSRFSPTRGRVVAYLGSYDPHTKTAEVDSEKASKYLQNGAQPSDRVARLLQKEGVKLPDWVKLDQPQTGATRNPDKRRSTRPAEPKAAAAEVPVAEAGSEDAQEEAPKSEAQTPEETPAEESPVTEDSSPEPDQEKPAVAEEAPAEEKPSE